MLVFRVLRVCERFGIDPRDWDGMDAEWKMQLLDYETVRDSQEAGQ
jgi:hypothetical protein